MAEENEEENAKNQHYQITTPPKEFRQGFEQLRDTFNRPLRRADSLSPVSKPVESATVTATVKQYIPDAGRNRTGQMLPLSIPYKEHLLDWFNDMQHNRNFYNEACSEHRQPRRRCLENRSGIAKLNHCSLCTCMSGNPRFADLHLYRQSGNYSGDIDMTSVGSGSPDGLPLPTNANDILKVISVEIPEEIYEEPRQIQLERDTLRAPPNQCDAVLPAKRSDSGDKDPLNTCLEVTRLPKTTRRLIKKWLIEKFSRFPGYRGYKLNSKGTKAQVYYNSHIEVVLACDNIQGTSQPDTESLNIEIIEIADSLNETNECWIQNLCCRCCTDSTSEEELSN